jgi:hypothetical protein
MQVVRAFGKYQAMVEEVVDIDRIVATHGRQVHCFRPSSIFSHLERIFA